MKKSIIVSPEDCRSTDWVKKAADAGFAWPERSYTLLKLREETQELEEAMAADDAENCFEEIGDVLFAAVNAARMLSVDPEAALHASCEKFIRRFRVVEQKLEENGKKMRDLSASELENVYQEARTCLKGKDKHFYLDKSKIV